MLVVEPSQLSLVQVRSAIPRASVVGRFVPRTFIWTVTVVVALFVAVRGDNAVGLGAASDAAHEAEVPPLLPLQVQLQGPVPFTKDGVPALHKLVVGLLVKVAPLAEPHAPLTGGVGATALTITLCGDVSLPRFAFTT